MGHTTVSCEYDNGLATHTTPQEEVVVEEEVLRGEVAASPGSHEASLEEVEASETASRPKLSLRQESIWVWAARESLPRAARTAKPVLLQSYAAAAALERALREQQLPSVPFRDDSRLRLR